MSLQDYRIDHKVATLVSIVKNISDVVENAQEMKFSFNEGQTESVILFSTSPNEAGSVVLKFKKSTKDLISPEEICTILNNSLKKAKHEIFDKIAQKNLELVKA